MSYNVRLYEYANSRQMRIYNKTIATDYEKEINENQETNQNSENNISYSDLDNPNNPYVLRNPFDNELCVDMEYYDYIEYKKKYKEKKQIQSKNRSKQNIYELARANTWEYFITLTFDREKVDSSNYDTLIKQVGKWFNNLKSRKAPNLKYLIIPELHKDGIHYHFHGLLACCDGLTFVDSGIKQNRKKVYNMPDFKFGFTTATKVSDTNKVSSYITKYITKDLESTLKGKRRYIASRNCERPKVTEYEMTEDEITATLDALTSEITYMKMQECPEFGQAVRYIELKK